MKTGIIPIISNDTERCHIANLREEFDSKVSMVRPESNPPPVNEIINNNNHHGIPRFLAGESPRSASTMLSLLVQKAVKYSVNIAIRKPADAPISILSKENE